MKCRTAFVLLISLCPLFTVLAAGPGIARAGTLAEQKPPIQSTHPYDIYWQDGPDLRGVDDRIFTSIVYDGLLIVGGHFDAAGNVITRRIAAWNGTSWSPLGSGLSEMLLGINRATVDALAIYDNKLIAAGLFLEAGGTPVGHIAAWDGGSWSALGAGLGNSVKALTVYDNKLIAAGSFSTAGGAPGNRIAAWDGSSWSPLGGGVGDGVVYALAVYDGQLIAAGNFTLVDGVGINNIAIWDGSNWSAFGSGTDGGVLSLLVDNNQLIAGGDFLTMDGIPASKVASWDGTSWSAMDGGLSDEVSSLAVYGNKIIAGCDWSTAPIASWDGTSWSALGSGIEGSAVYTLNDYNGVLVAAGYFKRAGGEEVESIAAWDGTAWSPICPGWANVKITRYALFDNELIAGGSFTEIGDIPAKNVAAFDGSTWSAMGAGIDNGITDLAVYSGKLFAGWSGGLSVWNGTSWSLVPLSPFGVKVLEVYDGKLHVGYGGSGGCILRTWDTSHWSLLPDNYSMDPRSNVCQLSDMVVYDNRLIVAGTFDLWPYSIKSLAAWDGTSWSSVGGSDATLWTWALGVYDNKLFVSGWSGYLRSWDGLEWSDLPDLDGDGNDVRSFTVFDGKLLAGGMWDPAYGAAPPGCNNVAAWDGVSWLPLGSGIGGTVWALSVYDGDLVAGGNCFSAGGKVSASFARWTGPISTAVPEVPALDVVLHQNTPNPFNPVTSIRYEIQEDSPVLLTVYSPSGRLVRTLVDENKPAGYCEAVWDGTNNAGIPVATGVYFYRLRAGKITLTKKMVLLK